MDQVILGVHCLVNMRANRCIHRATEHFLFIIERVDHRYYIRACVTDTVKQKYTGQHEHDYINFNLKEIHETKAISGKYIREYNDETKPSPWRHQPWMQPEQLCTGKQCIE